MRRLAFVSIVLAATVAGCGPAEKVYTVAELVQATTDGDKDKKVVVRGKVLTVFVEDERETFSLEGGFRKEPVLVGPKRLTVFLGDETDDRQNARDQTGKPTVRFDTEEQLGQFGLYQTPAEIYSGNVITVRGAVGEKRKDIPLVLLRGATFE